MGRAFRPPGRRRRSRVSFRRTLILSSVAALVVGAIVYFFGLDVVGSVVVTVVALGVLLVVGLTWESFAGENAVAWPQPPIRRTPGARLDVEELSWSMKTRGGVQDRTVARAREAARHRLLFLYGLDLLDPGDRPEIEKILAPGVVRTLLVPRATNLDLISFTRLLNAIEALGSPTERHT